EGGRGHPQDLRPPRQLLYRQARRSRPVHPCGQVDRRLLADGGSAARRMMMPSTLRPRVLLVEDNPADARLLRELLAEARHERFEIVHVDRVSEALARLADGEFEAMLLDLSL